ncbi:Helicase-like transcription factor CHR28 [Camellia lanceoleosa]|uniref:Helicase-like transcription factor CHR28 n=1 Tax=Camellia lanceoleosa TaxID=1840588 RepID=A0ACC0G502_9ERIC|nr:Helicase-like transcription factor CHR28 [Camellia lanceoleosa]
MKGKLLEEMEDILIIVCFSLFFVSDLLTHYKHPLQWRFHLSTHLQMPDDVDPFRNFVESTRRCCSFLSGLLCSLVSRHCTDLVGSPLGASYKLAGEGDHHSTVMAARETIDLTSSDSDSSWDLDEYREYESLLKETADSGNHEIISSRDSAVGATSRGRVGPSQEVPFPIKAFTSNGSSSNVDHYTEANLRLHPSSSEYVRASNWHTMQADNSNYSKENDYKKLSSQQAPKRTLPNSIQASAQSSRSSNLVENVSSSQIRDARGKSHHYAWPNLAKKNHMEDHFGRSIDDEVIVYENNGNRILPPSLMHGKSVSTSQYISSSDPIPRPGLVEERAVGSDERLIYQAALQDLNQPKVEATLPDGLLSVSLLRHQKIALAWMLQKETRSLHCLGGILADDQGLGKTISVIALVQMQRFLQSKSKPEGQSDHKPEALNLDDDDENGSATLEKGKQTGESDDVKLIPEATTSISELSRRRPAAGTLVVCPASVLRQWARELDDKVADEAKLSVLIYHGSNRTKDPLQLAKYDVVLTTYAIVTNEVPKQPLVDEDDEDQKNGEKYGLSSEFSANKKRKKTFNVGKRGKKGRNGIDSSVIDSDCGALARVGWFRVVLDEAQTIKNHRTQVARACCGLRAKRRWCLSGTPIQNAIDELYSYFRFLKYDPYAVYKSFCFTIKYPISRNSIHGYKKLQAVLRAIMLRRTKGIGAVDYAGICNLKVFSNALQSPCNVFLAEHHKGNQQSFKLPLCSSGQRHPLQMLYQSHLLTRLPARIFPLFHWRLVSLALVEVVELMEAAELFLVPLVYALIPLQLLLVSAAVSLSNSFIDRSSDWSFAASNNLRCQTAK